ncbi:MAG: biopolymer transporter Tol [Ignavibacteriaceae bacterium]|nr:biopolymer transporter Tol [Ignavibacteriaceae bacterium]
MKSLFYHIFFSFIFLSSAYSQFTEFHPELDWFTIKGENIQVHYHNGAERTAQVVAKIADEIWEPICSLYGYEPETVHYIIKDIDDYSNGATYFFDNKIEIWTSALDFDLRGTHNWLRNVISHEFTHMVQIQTAMKSSRSLPAAFLQVLNYEDERRPDILYGFPNFIASYPLATVNVPAWFAEGTAQYMRSEFDYDNWDSHRDMILRSYALDGKMLTWNEMGVFGKTSLGNESVYNSGFALTRFISQKYGEDKIREVTTSLGSFFNFTIDAAFNNVLGKSGIEIYEEWKNFITDDYKKRTQHVLNNKVEGKLIAEKGFGNFYPSFSKGGNKVYYISNKSSDYFSPSGIYELDINTKEEKLIVPGVRSTFSFIPGTDKIIYSKITDDNPNWYNVHDLYVYDVKEDEEFRLTKNLRANQPRVSNDGRQIVFLFQKDGTTNLGIVDIDGKNFRQLTFYTNGEQVYNPVFSNDDSYIYFDYSYHHTRDIARVKVVSGSPEFVISTEKDERNPAFDREGNLIFSSDKTGIYNIYKLDFKTGIITQLTNVVGGAFMPSVDGSENLVYAGYTSTGYKIFFIDSADQKNVDPEKKYVWLKNPPLDKSTPNGDISNFNINSLRDFQDKNVTQKQSDKYSGAFTKISFFPFLRYDNYNTTNKFLEKLKPGVYLSSSDMLNRYAIFAGGSINSRLERDLFLIFDYKNKLPLLTSLGLRPEISLELYSISRKANVDILFGADSSGGTVNYDLSIPTDVNYDLFEADFVARHRIFSRDQNLEFRFVFSRYLASLESFIIPGEDGDILYPTTDDTYLIGRNVQVKYSYESILPTKDDEINPIGMDIDLLYSYEFNKFNDEGEYTVEDGILKPKYNNFNFHKLELNSRIALELWNNHTLTAQFRGGSILGPAIPDFFDFYLGGLIGIKAYPFYSISGNEVGWINLTYRFPLFRNIDYKFGHLYLDKIFFSVFGDFGNAWTGKVPSLNKFKKGAGAEIRIQLNSYYLFPTNIFFNAAYGFDQFSRNVRNETVTYGKEWRFYGGILFGFDVLNFDKAYRR